MNTVTNREKRDLAIGGVLSPYASGRDRCSRLIRTFIGEGQVMSQGEIVEPTAEVRTVREPESEFEDKGILCIDCSRNFVWTSGEQAFFRDKQLQNPPKRCKECKQAKNERLAAITAAQASGVRQRIEVAVNCARCGEMTTVPFYPSQGRPVYCRSCYLEMNPSILNGQGS